MKQSLPAPLLRSLKEALRNHAYQTIAFNKTRAGYYMSNSGWVKDKSAYGHMRSFAQNLSAERVREKIKGCIVNWLKQPGMTPREILQQVREHSWELVIDKELIADLSFLN